MSAANGYSRDKVLGVVIDTVTTVSPDVGPVDAASHLMGNQAILDSVGFITLLVSLEQNLGSTVDLSASFMEQGNVEEKSNPFLTVGALADHIHRLMTMPA